MAEALDLFEDELLEVAGRKGASASGKKRSKRAAHSDDDDDSDPLADLSDEEDERGRGRKKGGSSSKGGKQPASKRQRASARDEEEEEDDDDDADGSDLYFDEEDRRKLEAMTEFEREMILADRAEERDKARQRKEVIKKAREAVRMTGREGGGTHARPQRPRAGQISAERAPRERACSAGWRVGKLLGTAPCAAQLWAAAHGVQPAAPPTRPAGKGRAEEQPH